MYRGRFASRVIRSRRNPDDIFVSLFKSVLSLLEVRFILSMIFVFLFILFGAQEKLEKLGSFFWGDSYKSNDSFLKISNYFEHIVASLIFLPLLFVVPKRVATFAMVLITFIIFMVPMTDAYTYMVECILICLLLKTTNKRVQLVIIIAVIIAYSCGYFIHSKDEGIIFKLSNSKIIDSKTTGSVKSPVKTA